MIKYISKWGFLLILIGTRSTRLSHKQKTEKIMQRRESAHWLVHENRNSALDFELHRWYATNWRLIVAEKIMCYISWKCRPIESWCAERNFRWNGLITWERIEPKKTCKRIQTRKKTNQTERSLTEQHFVLLMKVIEKESEKRQEKSVDEFLSFFFVRPFFFSCAYQK